MPDPALVSHLVHFGAFEVDLRSAELRKHGLKLKIQEQPFQVLAMLLERPGQIVTREELHKKLWPADTFVDFEHGLNAAINKLREALGDSADNPRFIETLPRRGYRFVAPVSGEEDKTVDSKTAVKGRNRKIAVKAAIAFLVGAVVAVAWLWHSHLKPRLSEKDTIVLGDFSNSTGDAVFDDTLKQALSVALRQSPFLNVLSDSEIAKTLE